MSHEKPLPNHLGVVVLTTSGRWPTQGGESTPINQPVHVVLAKAARELAIVDTTGWIATVGGREINVSSSFADNGLTGEVTIDFGPRAAGGGRA